VLSALPGRGRLLISGPAGTWTVAGDGSTRHLGPWRQASWSPHGRYVAVTAGDRLTVVDAHGTQLWTLRRPAATDPRWYSPSGFRIAYLSNTALRVVAGDGTGDHPVAAGVANVAPAWRPGHPYGPYELAYVTNRGRVVVRDGDTGQLIWSTARGLHARSLAWSDDGEHLLALSPTAGRVYDGSGRLASTIALPRHVAESDGALSPDGSAVALVLGGNEVVVASAGSSKPGLRRVLAGSGLREVAFSPDGRWLLVSWPAADQWVFVRAVGAPGIAAVSRIAEQFSTPGGPRGFPQLDGWCCTARRPAG
jgi:WD40 repeat protein